MRLGVAETIVHACIVHACLARFIERVHALYPGVTLEIEVDVSPTLRAALLAQDIDIAFLLGPPSEQSPVDLALSRCLLAIAASPALNLPPEPVPLAALVRVPIITYPETTRPTIALAELLRRSNLSPPRHYSSSSLATIVRMTLDGIGVGVIPPVVVARELDEGRLRLVRTEIEPRDLSFGVLPFMFVHILAIALLMPPGIALWLPRAMG